MTREDIDNIISVICPNDEDFEKACISPAYLKKELETLALEQELCEDCISREAAIRACCGMSRFTGIDEAPYEYVEDVLRELPSVKPKERTGHWIAVYQGDEIINYRCSECEFGNTFGKNTDGMYYCPNCGAKMKE